MNTLCKITTWHCTPKVCMFFACWLVVFAAKAHDFGTTGWAEKDHVSKYYQGVMLGIALAYGTYLFIRSSNRKKKRRYVHGRRDAKIFSDQSATALQEQIDVNN